MAELILTDEEKKRLPDSLLAWPNEELGKVVKFMAAITSEDPKGTWQVADIACAAFLVHRSIESGSDDTTITFGSFRVSGADSGDWEVLIRRKDGT